MSIDALRSFLEGVGKNQTLQHTLNATLGQATDREAALAALAAEHGYEVSVNDVQVMLASASGTGELKDDDLAKVAGGVASMIGSPGVSRPNQQLGAIIWGDAMPLRRR